MARGRGRRDAHDITNDTLSDLLGPADVPRIPLSQVEDRRREVVEVSPPARDLFGRSARVVPGDVFRTRNKTRSKRRPVADAMYFQAPLDVAICVRRQQRKEVLLAKGKGGRNRAPRSGPFSHIRCRRK